MRVCLGRARERVCVRARVLACVPAITFGSINGDIEIHLLGVRCVRVRSDIHASGPELTGRVELARSVGLREAGPPGTQPVTTQAV